MTDIPPPIVVRFARQDDAETIVRFNSAMARETESKELIASVITEGVNALLAKPELGFYLIAEQNGTVAGSLMVTTEWSDWRNGSFWWIQSVYVLPANRKQGVYRRLYEFVKSEAGRNKSVCGFRLYVEKDNMTAQKAYASLGMKETEYKLFEELKMSTRFFEGAA